MYNDKKSHHTVPAQKSKISKQMIGGKVLNFFLCKDHKTTLIFARLSYYFTPYNRLTDDSLSTDRFTGSQSRPRFSVLPLVIENITSTFFQYVSLESGVQLHHEMNYN